VATALVVCRLLHFSAAMLLFGVSAFLWALAPPELAGALASPIRRMAGAAIVVAAISAVAWLALEAGQMGEGWADSVNPEVLGAVAFDTDFGRVWLWRIGLSALLLGALALGRHDRWAFVVPISGLLLASLGLVGHAAIQTGPMGAIHRFNQGLHLLCAGAWLGALPPLLLCLAHFGDPQLRSKAALALRRFSGVGHFLVALVVLTGVLNTIWTLGAWPLDFSSPYQALLATKISLVALMIGMALVNRYVLAPRIGPATGFALRALALNSVAELALGFAVLALVSALGTFAPA
jgi:copper resistance protein D